MKIQGTVHCFFEQSGVYRDQFRNLGFQAFDYDIANDFGKTDYVVDLFQQILRAYDNEDSIFDGIAVDELVVAFFPCIYFCNASQLRGTYAGNKEEGLTIREQTDRIISRYNFRNMFAIVLTKLIALAKMRNFRLIVENPYSPVQYLIYPQNFCVKYTFIDYNRTIRGDLFKKPTAYWFINCEPTYGLTTTQTPPHQVKKINNVGKHGHAGICDSARSMVTPTYARNFICDFILGKEQPGSQTTLF